MNTARRYIVWFVGGLLLSLVAAELILRSMGALAIGHRRPRPLGIPSATYR